MHSDQSQKLLGHLYQIVPERKSAIEISKDVFGNTPVNEMLGELLQEGYVFQWKNDPEDKAPSSAQDRYGITISGILFFGKFSGTKKPDLSVDLKSAPAIEKKVVLAETNIEPAEKEDSTFRRVLPVIIFIAFAIAIVWFIIHIKNKAA